MVKLAKTSLLVAAAALSLSASDILVTVNGKNITKQDAQTFVSAAMPNGVFAQLDPKEQAMIKERLVEKVLFGELAQKEGIENDPEYKKNLEMIKQELMLNIWMKKQLDNIIVSDSEAKAFYDKNKEKFMQEETAQAKHILLKEEKEAKAVIDQLKSLSGDALRDKFVELAKAKSVDTASGINGGELGTFTKGQMVPEFAEAAWAMEEGKSSAVPVKTQFGYHVIYLEKKMPAAPVAYESVKEKILATLKQQQFGAKINEMAKELKSKATIVDPDKKSDKK